MAGDSDDKVVSLVKEKPLIVADFIVNELEYLLRLAKEGKLEQIAFTCLHHDGVQSFRSKYLRTHSTMGASFELLGRMRIHEIEVIRDIEENL